MPAAQHPGSRKEPKLIAGEVTVLYQRPQALTDLAHSRRVMEAIRSGMAMRAFQAWQQVSTMAS
jgi:hypothetical protein